MPRIRVVAMSVAFATATACSAAGPSGTSIPTMSEAVGASGEFSGEVIENVRRCRVDGYCFLRVATTTGKVVEVFYGGPRTIRCPNAEALSETDLIEPGRMVRVRALMVAPGEFDACAATGYFIKPAGSRQE